jgi:hypothetical protein
VWGEADLSVNKNIVKCTELYIKISCQALASMWILVIMRNYVFSYYSVSCGLSAAPAPVGTDTSRQRSALNGTGPAQTGTRPAQTDADHFRSFLTFLRLEFK